MKAVAGVLRVMPLVGRAFGIARMAMMLLARGVLRAGLMMMANPMVLLIMAIVVAVGLLGYVVYRNWDKIKLAFSKGWASLKSIMSSMAGGMASLGKMMMQGLLMALNPMLLAERLLSVAKTGVTAFKNYFGIKSPSRLMMAMGGHIATGLGVGMDQHAHRPKAAMRRMAAAVAGAGALALSPAASARASAAPRTPLKLEVHIHQQPGEDADALIERLMKAIERKKRAAGLSSYDDEY